jgi:hypothetical protein
MQSLGSKTQINETIDIDFAIATWIIIEDIYCNKVRWVIMAVLPVLEHMDKI